MCPLSIEMSRSYLPDRMLSLAIRNFARLALEQPRSSCNSVSNPIFCALREIEPEDHYQTCEGA
jgi:hypothetical protein